MRALLSRPHRPIVVAVAVGLLVGCGAAPDDGGDDPSAPSSPVASAMTAIREADRLTIDRSIDEEGSARVMARDRANDSAEITTTNEAFLTVRRVGTRYFVKTDAAAWEITSGGDIIDFPSSVENRWYEISEDSDMAPLASLVDNVPRWMSDALPKGRLDPTGETEDVDDATTEEFASPIWRAYISTPDAILLRAVSADGTAEIDYRYDEDPLLVPDDVVPWPKR